MVCSFSILTGTTTLLATGIIMYRSIFSHTADFVLGTVVYTNFTETVHTNATASQLSMLELVPLSPSGQTVYFSRLDNTGDERATAPSQPTNTSLTTPPLHPDAYYVAASHGGEDGAQLNTPDTSPPCGMSTPCAQNTSVHWSKICCARGHSQQEFHKGLHFFLLLFLVIIRIRLDE